MIKVNQIEKNYGKFHLNCTMEVPDGCVTGLIGENGKSYVAFRVYGHLLFILHGCCISRKELSRKKGSFPSVV